jgi:hypothetical protein
MIGCMPEFPAKYAYVFHFIFFAFPHKVNFSGDRNMPNAQKTLIRTLAGPMGDSSH